MNTKKLRQKILDLAIRGKLVPQDPNDEPASALLKRIRKERERLIAEGKIKPDKKVKTAVAASDKSHYGELPFEVPNSWALAYLGFLGTFERGKGIKRSDIRDFGTRCIRYGELYTTYNFIIKSAVSFVSDDLAEQSKTVASGDLLFTLTGENKEEIGKAVAFMGSDRTVIGGDLAKFTNYGVDPIFLSYILNASDLIHQKMMLGIGDLIVHISCSKLSSILLPVPPIEEQRHIVTAIESAFTVIDEIERYKTDLHAAVTAAKQKILTLAISGKLVPQDPSDEPASALLERIKEEREKLIKEGKIKPSKQPKTPAPTRDSSHYADLPNSWEITNLSAITTPLSLSDGDWILSDYMVPYGDVKLLQLSSIGYMKYIDKNFKYLTTKMFDELRCTEIHPGYLLINRLLGDKLNVCILPNISGKLITTVDTCWIAPNDNFHLKFLMYGIASKSFQDAVFLHSAGSTRKRISKGNLTQIPFPLPPLAEQRRIVAAIEAVFSQLDAITNEVQ